MRALVLILLFAIWLAIVLLWAGTPGVFQGKVVVSPDPQQDGWLFVQAPNGSVRRVQVADAQFAYGEEVPRKDRQSVVPRKLPSGTRVRVTAEQNSSGEWRASRVEIVQISASVAAH